MAADSNLEDRKTKRLLAIFFSVLFGLVMAGLFWRAVPDQNRELVSAAVGFIAGWVTAFINFYTGSTAGSETKTETIAHQAKAAAAASEQKVDQAVINAETATVNAEKEAK